MYPLKFFGPEDPNGYETNFIPTGGEDFFLLFRLNGPSSKDFFKTWMLSDVEKMKQNGEKELDPSIQIQRLENFDEFGGVNPLHTWLERIY